MPNFTVTGEVTLAPFFGLTMYTLAPGGEGVRSCAQATEAARASTATAILDDARRAAPQGRGAERRVIMRMARVSIWCSLRFDSAGTSLSQPGPSRGQVSGAATTF